MIYIDFHTHKLRNTHRDDVVEIVSLHLGKEADHRLYTVGKHPWWTDHVITSEESRILARHLSHPDCLAMGEMGLDKLKGPPMPLQESILSSQLTIAQDEDVPVIIHCVRAYDQLIQIKKLFPGIKKWCIHGYPRHKILARQLLDQGFFLSLMPTSKINNTYEELIRYMPSDRLFLETDSMPGIYIDELYLQVATILDIRKEELSDILLQNARTFFDKWEIG